MSKPVYASAPCSPLADHGHWAVDESTLSRRIAHSRKRSLPTSFASSQPAVRPQATFVLPSPSQPVVITPTPSPRPVTRNAAPSGRSQSTYVLPSGPTSRRSSPPVHYSPYPPPPRPARNDVNQEPGAVFVNYVLASDGGVVSTSSRPRTLANSRRTCPRSRSYLPQATSSAPQFYRDGAGHRPMTICL